MKKEFNWNKWTRKTHYWGAFVIILPISIVITTGILLQLKKEINWIQPPTSNGEHVNAPTISFDNILASVKTADEANITSWDDVDRLDEMFDIVLFFGVYYHLKDPILAIKKLSDITNENLFLSGHSLDTTEPLMYFYKPYEKNNKPYGRNYENFAEVVASPESLISIGEKYGFQEVKTLDVMDMQLNDKYPHMAFGDKTQKVLTMNFIK